MSKNTLYDKVIDMHTVEGGQIVVGRVVIHEVTSNPACFERLRDERIPVVNPDRTFAVMDHILNTRSSNGRPLKDDTDERMAETLEANVRDFGINYFAPGSGKGGVCHVVFPEQGLIWPGMTVVCGDSHTSTYGAFGAIGMGVGSTQLGHALGSGTVKLDERLKVRRINVVGIPGKGVLPKDVVMYAIQRLGAKAGNGFAHEFGGEVVDSMSMEGRMTLCNMGVEGGAKVAYVNPDEKTFEYLRGKPYAPRQGWKKAVEFWRSVASNNNAVYDDVKELDVSGLAPRVSWGIVSDQSIGVDERVPVGDEKALAYMGLKAGQPILGTPVDVVFIGSCTNGRVSDFRAAAAVLRGRNVAVRTLCVPGSERVRRECEEKGYAEALRQAGAEWRYSGCSMCLSMSPDTLMKGERTASTSNRNFAHRQGRGARTHLMSPYTAAATAIEGKIADPRGYL